MDENQSDLLLKIRDLIDNELSQLKVLKEKEQQDRQAKFATNKFTKATHTKKLATFF